MGFYREAFAMRKVSATVLVAVVIAVGVTRPTRAGGDEDGVKKELEKVAGSWQLVSVEKDGRKAPDDEVKQLKLTITRTRYTLRRADRVVEEGTVEIDPARKPRGISIYPTRPEGKVQLGIYEWDGDDKLRICFTHPGTAQTRPTEFSTTKGPGHVMQVCKREKAR